MKENKHIIDVKSDICIDYAEDAANSLSKLIEMLKNRDFSPRIQLLMKDVISLMGDVCRDIGELQVLENMRFLYDDFHRRKETEQ